MQMIAASKLKRAQQATFATRPYVEKLTSITQSISAKIDPTVQQISPLLQNNATSGKTLYIVISPDKGLCGALVTNLIREYLKFNRNEDALFVVVGKKIEGIAATTTKNLVASFHAGTTLPTFDQVAPIATIIDEQYTQGKVDAVKIITTHFNSVFSQSPQITNLLPIRLEEVTTEREPAFESTLIEPSPQEILPALLKRYIDMNLYQHLLENYVSFQAAQMIAMQNATNNAKDIVSDLTLLYNKLRQEKITSEILDISSAAVALVSG